MVRAKRAGQELRGILFSWGILPGFVVAALAESCSRMILPVRASVHSLSIHLAVSGEHKLFVRDDISHPICCKLRGSLTLRQFVPCITIIVMQLLHKPALLTHHDIYERVDLRKVGQGDLRERSPTTENRRGLERTPNKKG